jgi:hypothetical protein
MGQINNSRFSKLALLYTVCGACQQLFRPVITGAGVGSMGRNFALFGTARYARAAEQGLKIVTF